jgi:phosphotriesterase-related protein
MDIESLKGKVQSVLGSIEPEELGITLPHEHIIGDGTSAGGLFVEPREASIRILAHQPLTLENLSWVRYHTKYNLDAQIFSDEQMAIKEVMLFRKNGGNSIVELTNIGLSRDPQSLARISRETGIHVIMGTGYYVEGSYPKKEMDAKTEKDVADEIINDIVAGVGNTGICSGIIGELGCSWPLRDNEKKVLRAGAYAQQKTGCSISIHPSRNESAPIEIIEILRDVGADLNRVVMCHMDRCGLLFETRRQLAEVGCYLEYDLFGWEGYYSIETALADDHMPDMPNDIQRIKEIKELIDLGYVNQILLSHDLLIKWRLSSYGGHGYAHLLCNVVPYMKLYGISHEQINTMMVENPKRLLTIV